MSKISNTISKKGTSNKELKRDTFIIFQLFLLILVILLVAKKLETFKTRKNKEQFQTYDDTVKIKLSNGKELRLGYLEDIITPETPIAYFSESLLKKSYLYDSITQEKTETKYDEDMCESISVKFGYSVIIYEGSTFDKNKHSILIKSKGSANINLDDEYNFTAIRSIKVYKTTNESNIRNLEAHENNQILLFTGKDYRGHILRINLPQKNNLKMNLPISHSKFTKNEIYKSILFPGDSDFNNPTYRNINLSLFTKDGKEHEYIKNEFDINNKTGIKGITHFKVAPKIPTLDINTAENILENNLNRLNKLHEKLNTVKKSNICKNSLIHTKQYKVVNKLSDNLISKILDQNNEYNFMIYDHDI